MQECDWLSREGSLAPSVRRKTMAESYLDQGLEGWVDAHSAPHMAIRDMDCADWQAFQIGVLAVPTAGALDYNAERIPPG
jgi:hypothetical protein